MSYYVAVTNNSNVEWNASDGTKIPASGGEWRSQEIGDAWVNCVQSGTINFHDIGDTHIGGDSSETWGVLISYQGEEMVGRYEGGGQLIVSINGYYQATLGGMDIRQVSLNGLLIAQ
jgi:hypothetical protein